MQTTVAPRTGRREAEPALGQAPAGWRRGAAPDRVQEALHLRPAVPAAGHPGRPRWEWKWLSGVLGHAGGVDSVMLQELLHQQDRKFESWLFWWADGKCGMRRNLSR